MPITPQEFISKWKRVKILDPVCRSSNFLKELVKQRDRWFPTSEVSTVKRTLTNLYNQRPTWLELEHKKLDDAVFAAYGWKNTLSDEEILERLLALNLERSK